MDLQKVASTGTAVVVIGGGSIFGGNYVVDQATGGPQKEIEAKQIRTSTHNKRRSS